MAKRKQREAEGQWVSIEEQERQGLRRPRPQGQGEFVAPAPKQELARRQMPAETHVEHVISVPPSATQVVEVQTSAVDRAKGQLISTVPLFALIGFAVDLLAYQFVDYPLVSITSITIIVLAAVVAWVATWLYTLSISGEAVSKYEARRKWNVVDREQKKRWEYYERENRK